MTILLLYAPREALHWCRDWSTWICCSSLFFLSFLPLLQRFVAWEKGLPMNGGQYSVVEDGVNHYAMFRLSKKAMEKAPDGVVGGECTSSFIYLMFGYSLQNSLLSAGIIRNPLLRWRRRAFRWRLRLFDLVMGRLACAHHLRPLAAEELHPAAAAGGFFGRRRRRGDVCF